MELYSYQIEAIDKLKSGSILCGGVGSGKSRTALAYYILKECSGSMKINSSGQTRPMKNPKDLYIITTARKRDTLDWEKECVPFCLSKNRENNPSKVIFTVDSWNNIKKYIEIKNCFFIFDEQRVIGSGSWVKSFLSIVKNNKWILLSATPGDTWMDYIPVFIANGFYKNRTDFLRQHAVYKRYGTFFKVDYYINTGKLNKQRNDILVNMDYNKKTIPNKQWMDSIYNKLIYREVMKNRWNIYKSKPIEDASELCFVLRRIVNEDPSRLEIIKDIIKDHKKIILFYNFDYELLLIKTFCKANDIFFSEWNGHEHQLIPKEEKWIYLVQYNAGSEGWNCIETNTIVFFSLNYSYRTMVQAAGRIDRLNTPYINLYYYYIRSTSPIDLSISKALKDKKVFNESKFLYSHRKLMV